MTKEWTKEEALAWVDGTATTDHPGDICARTLARIVRGQDVEIARLKAENEVNERACLTMEARAEGFITRAEAAEKERDELRAKLKAAEEMVEATKVWRSCLDGVDTTYAIKAVRELLEALAKYEQEVK